MQFVGKLLNAKQMNIKTKTIKTRRDFFVIQKF